MLKIFILGMTPIVVTVACGEWAKEQDLSYHWIPKDTLGSIIVDTDITLAKLEEKLRLKFKVDQNKIVLKLSYACDSRDLTNQPIFFRR